MRQQRHDVRSERKRIEVLQVARRGVPVDAVNDLAQHGLRDVLHTREAVEDRVVAVTTLRAECRAKAAVADHDGGRAVAHGFGQAGCQLDLEVEVQLIR